MPGCVTLLACVVLLQSGTTHWTALQQAKLCMSALWTVRLDLWHHVQSQLPGTFKQSRPMHWAGSASEAYSALAHLNLPMNQAVQSSECSKLLLGHSPYNRAGVVQGNKLLNVLVEKLQCCPVGPNVSSR